MEILIPYYWGQSLPAWLAGYASMVNAVRAGGSLPALSKDVLGDLSATYASLTDNGVDPANVAALYDFRSTHNAGTDTTAYSIIGENTALGIGVTQGAATAPNNITLINGVTWTANGLTCVAASSGYLIGNTSGVAIADEVIFMDLILGTDPGRYNCYAAKGVGDANDYDEGVGAAFLRQEENSDQVKSRFNGADFSVLFVSPASAGSRVVFAGVRLTNGDYFLVNSSSQSNPSSGGQTPSRVPDSFFMGARFVNGAITDFSNDTFTRHAHVHQTLTVPQIQAILTAWEAL